MSVTERGHLSIGEVLSLLQGEFPDVTISKIRFLESQGLIDPERTPSGYRKFYEADIDRLRWILIQQRDHFLPLKIIKDRLAEGADTFADVPAGAARGEESEGEAADIELSASPSASARPSGSASAPGSNGWTAQATAAEPADAAPLPWLAHARHSGGNDAPGATADVPPPAGGEREPHSSPVTTAEGDPTDAEPSARTPEVDPHPDPDRHRDAVSPGDPGRRPAQEHGPDADPAPDTSATLLTAPELLAAAGITTAQLSDLERYGLIETTAAGGGQFYDEHALVLASLASRFAVFGIEARHLRMFKVALDRELALYAQVVGPITHARAPGGPARAAVVVEQLCDLGRSMREALLAAPIEGVRRRR